MITREDIGKYSSGILDLFEREKIDSIEGLQKRLGESFDINDGTIQLEARPGGLKLIPDRIVYTLSYIIQGKGIQIEVRLNNKIGYFALTVKSSSLIKGYFQITRDPLGNIIQGKRFEPSFDKLKEELRDLSE